LRTGIERLANYLLREVVEQDARTQLTLPMDKRTLASHLGMTPENLSRGFGTLKGYGCRSEGGRNPSHPTRSVALACETQPAHR
jgi:CRP/FNR family transcriptional activator FtrB